MRKREVLLRLKVIALAPIEVIGCTIIGAVRGFVDGMQNSVDAWQDIEEARHDLD